jgi:hypothetical protein
MVRTSLPAVLLMLLTTAAALAQGNKVQFNESGITFVNGRPFFPIGIWIYGPDDHVLKDVQAKGFNTVIGNGFGAEHFDRIFAHDMMVVPFSNEQTLAVKHHPALLAWYLVDEPENGQSPEEVAAAYQKLKQQDPDHPIGLCHYLFEAFEKFKDGCDFSMSDVYPVTANRDVPLRNVGIHMDQARAVHHPNWPVWTYIQIFGGPDTDGGKWAVPEPEEIRCMTYIALVHRANAMLYFAYWAKEPRMWASVGDVVSELRLLTPWLIADGQECPVTSSTEQVQVRAKKVSTGWLIIAVNTDRSEVKATLTIEGLGNTRLRMPFNNNRDVRPVDGQLTETFAPCEVKVFGIGRSPPAPRLLPAPPRRPGR